MLNDTNRAQQDKFRVWDILQDKRRGFFGELMI